MLTKQQQEIIANMSESFAKVNEQFSKSKSFNLVNIDELQMLNRKKEEFEENIRIAKKNWNELAESEVYRIISLLKEDLPFAVIEKMGKENRHHESNSIMIGRTKDSLIGHPERHIIIYLNSFDTKAIEDEYGNYGSIPVGLSYSYYSSGDKKEKFRDIQELCSHKYFAQQIRSRIL